MVRGDGIANLLEDRGLRLAGGGATMMPRVPLPMGVTRSITRVSIRSGDVSNLNFLNRINRGEVLKAHRFGVILKSHFVDPIHGLELGAGATVRRLGGAFDKSCLPRRQASRRMVSGVTKISVGLG